MPAEIPPEQRKYWADQIDETADALVHHANQTLGEVAKMLERARKLHQDAMQVRLGHRPENL